ncbi:MULTISPECIES: Rv3235 family protein [Micrococcaceae]|uniref:Rv3235 family protein n=1 Tax=unclassified Kocuria TaxID=2649579 RepID=UPI0010135724|nr:MULTISPECIES: Rv3235 family protein [unclassified Kocuria]
MSSRPEHRGRRRVNKRGTVLSIENLRGTPRAHPEGPPSFYKWRDHSTDPREELRRVHAIAGTMGVAIIEVISGKRSPSQLVRWVHPRVLERIERRATIETAEGPVAAEPIFGNKRFNPTNLRPRRVRAIPVGHNEYEASVVVGNGDRCRALALRIHKARGQWQIIQAEIG